MCAESGGVNPWNPWNSISDAAGWLQTGIHTGLDIAGVWDPTGVTDLWNAAGYAGEAMAGQGGWGNAAISAVAIAPYVGDLGKIGKYGTKALKYSDEAAALLKQADQVGSYTTTFRSGMKYHGKGPISRARRTARELSRKYSDEAAKIDWTPAKNAKEAFIDEAKRIKKHGGVKHRNYNKINSPGKKYLPD